MDDAENNIGVVIGSAPNTPPPSSPVTFKLTTATSSNLPTATTTTNSTTSYDDIKEGGEDLIDRKRWHQEDMENKQLFLKRLYTFLEQQGQPITKMPSLGYQELDLHHLYCLVTARGGMDQVTQRQEWKSVYQELGIPTMSTSASYNTRTNYKKYLYLYELEHCDFPDQPRPKGKEPKFRIGEFVRIVSETYEGQVFYAQILKCRYRDGTNVFYVHYNGWSTSHDEWMPEQVLAPLLIEERTNPESLMNPSPSRSSKSNHIISDLYFVGEKHFHPRTPKKDAGSSGEATPARRSKPISPTTATATGASTLAGLKIKGEKGHHKRPLPHYTLSEEEEMLSSEEADILFDEKRQRRRRKRHGHGRRRYRPDWTILKREISNLRLKQDPSQLSWSFLNAHDEYDDSRSPLLGDTNLHSSILQRIQSENYDIDGEESGGGGGLVNDESSLQHLELNPYEPTKMEKSFLFHQLDQSINQRWNQLRQDLHEQQRQLQEFLAQKDLLERALAEKIAQSSDIHHPNLRDNSPKGSGGNTDSGNNSSLNNNNTNNNSSNTRTTRRTATLIQHHSP